MDWDQIDKACESVGAVEASKEFEFPVELQEEFWLCVSGGMSLASFIWKVKKAVVRAATDSHDTKLLASKALGISTQTIWNIEQDRHK
jgi:hypothetical protein